MAEIVSEMADPTFSYDDVQQLYCLNAVSNVVGKKRGTSQQLQTIMQQALDKCLPALKSDWKVVWGPTIYKKDPNDASWGPVNAWYVAKSESKKTYVVAIAGTPLFSARAWERDFDVLNVVHFDSWVKQWTPTSVPEPDSKPWDRSTGPLIAGGTGYFTHNVLSNAPPANAASSGVLLGDFLQRNVAGCRVVFTGHSMGGAVSPTLALGLRQAGLLSKAASVLALPSAGATPGNEAFTNQFKQTFRATGPFNTNLFNTLDIVPQAFGLDEKADRSIQNIIKKIYTPNIITKWAWLFVVSAYNRVKNIVDRSMPYVNLPGRQFTGAKIPDISDLVNLFKQIGIQHSAYYWDFLGIRDFVHYFSGILEKYGLHDAETQVPSEGELEAEIAAEAESQSVPTAEIKAAQATTEEVPAHDIDV